MNPNGPNIGETVGYIAVQAYMVPNVVEMVERYLGTEVYSSTGIHGSECCGDEGETLIGI